MSDRYRKGSHTVHDIKYHFVWKTKYNYTILRGDIALRTRQVLMEICETRSLRIVSGNVRSNHIHMMVSCPTDVAPSKIIQYLKGKSSYRLQREFKELQKRYWGSTFVGKRLFLLDSGSCK